MGSICLDIFHLTFVETKWDFVQLCVYTSLLVCNTTFISSFMGGGSIYHSRHSMDSATGHHEAAQMDFSWILQNQQHQKRWDFGSKTPLASFWGQWGENLLLLKNLNESQSTVLFLPVLYLEKAMIPFQLNECISVFSYKDISKRHVFTICLTG